MSLIKFMIKCVFITVCLGILLFNFYPRYEVIHVETQCLDKVYILDKVNGKIETKKYFYDHWS